MDPITDQPNDEPAPRRRTATRGLLAAGAAVVALGIGAVGASAGSGSAATDASPASGSTLVQETTPQQPADPAPRGDKPPCPEGEDRGSQGSGGAAQTPDAGEAALS